MGTGQREGDSGSSEGSPQATPTTGRNGAATGRAQGSEIKELTEAISRLHDRIDQREDRLSEASSRILASTGPLCLLVIAVAAAVLPKDTPLSEVNGGLLGGLLVFLGLAFVFSVATLVPLKVNVIKGATLEKAAEGQVLSAVEIAAMEANEAESRQENLSFRFRLLVIAATAYLIGTGFAAAYLYAAATFSPN